MLGILFSGGKDSVFTTYYYIEQGWDVRCLITLEPKNPDSWMFHTPAVEMTKLQSQALGIPLIPQPTCGEKEEELKDLEAALAKAKKEYRLRAIAVGALLSDYQQERVNRICHSLGLKCFAPLWHKDQEKLLREIISLGFEIYIVGVASQGLTGKWLGRRIDADALLHFAILHKKFGFHVGGEGGEYESLVLDCPLFKKKLKINKSRIEMENECTGKLIVEDAELVQT